jgi:hypothetical protein
MDDNRPRGPGFRYFGYVTLVVIAVLVAWFVVRPLGLQVSGVFQTLVNAFSHR